MLYNLYKGNNTIERYLLEIGNIIERMMKKKKR
jgi:hypothetical protein